MSADHFEILFKLLLRRRPFRPFTIRLKCGEQFEIDHARALKMIRQIAQFAAPGSIPVFFDADSVSTVIDAPAGDIPNQPPTTPT